MHDRFDAQRGQRHQEGQREGDGQEDVDGCVGHRPRQLSTKSPPHQGLIHLVDREKQRQRGEHHLLWPARVADGIDANGPDDHTGGEVGLRREAHQVAPRSRLIATPRRSRAPFVMTAAGPRVTTAAMPHDARRQR